MAAYIIVDVKINNSDAYEQYKKLTPDSISAYQGSFIVRGGPTEILEGDWVPGRIVVLEFPNAELARQWWNFEEYAAPKVIRQGASVTRMILAEGVGA